MKNTIINVFFKVLCLAIISLTTLTLHAQPFKYAHLSQEEKENKSLELINQADYVVEGKSTDFRYFYGDDGKTIYTEYTFEVSHWYKGKGEKTISLIREGGRIGLDNQIDDHKSYLNLGDIMTYIILLKEGDKKGTYEFLEEEKRAIIRSNDKSRWGGFYGLGFLSYQDLNTFLSKGKDIKTSVKKKDVGSQKSSVSPPMMIDDFTPSVIRAGTGEVLVISGSGFGTTRGKVLFRNADDPEEEVFPGVYEPVYLNNIDDFYYDTSNPNGNNPTGWKDDEIRVIVPSWVPSSGEDGAGSGKIKVQRADGTIITSDEVLNIEYALINLGDEADIGNYPPQHPHIGKEHCLSGYVFTLHKSFKTHPMVSAAQLQDARNSIEAALSVWRSKLGITLELEEESENNYQYVDFQEDANNFRMIISFDSGVSLMRNRHRHIWDQWAAAPKAYRHAGGFIKVNPNVTWQYKSTGGLNAGQYDFYAAMLHEIGHYLGVDHSIVPVEDAMGNPTEDIDYNNIMSYAYAPAPSGGLPQGSRMTLNNYNNNTTTVIGNQLIVSASRNHNWSPAFKTLYGVEKLAPAGSNSMVQPTPKISMSKAFPVGGPIYGNPKISLKPLPFNPAYDYYWWWENTTLGNKTADQLNNVSVCSNRDYWVRLKNPSCSVSSLYSLPQLFKLPGCISTGGWRDGNLIVSPNPTSGQIDIAFNSIEEERSIENTYIGIYDNLGGLQIERKISDPNSRRSTINISELPAGTYWVIWFSGNGEVIATEQVQKIN